jgi:hypothetical protein
MGSIVYRESDPQILTDLELAEARVEQDGTADRRLKDPSLAQPAQMIELQHVRTLVAAKQLVVTVGGQGKDIRSIKALQVEVLHTGKHIVECRFDRGPRMQRNAAPALDIHQAGESEVGDAVIDHIFLASGNRLGCILHGAQIERQ